MKILGIENVNYTSKKTGRDIHAVRLHCSESARNVQGERVETLFVPQVVFDSTPVQVGDEIRPLYNRFGRVEAVEVLE